MLSFVVAGIACVFAALCYAEFASMVPVAGSAYTYAYATLGELFAWIIGWDLILEYAVASATVAHGWSHYFQDVPAVLRHPVCRTSFSNAPFDYDPDTGRLVAHGHVVRPARARHHRCSSPSSWSTASGRARRSTPAW